MGASSLPLTEMKNAYASFPYTPPAARLSYATKSFHARTVCIYPCGWSALFTVRRTTVHILLPLHCTYLHCLYPVLVYIFIHLHTHYICTYLHSLHLLSLYMTAIIFVYTLCGWSALFTVTITTCILYVHFTVHTCIADIASLYIF